MIGSRKKRLLVIFIALIIGILFSALSWQAKPLPWKYTFNYSYLPEYAVNFFDSPKSLFLIPLIVFVGFEAMFVYTVVSPAASLLILITIIPVMSMRFVSVNMNIYIHIVFLAAILTAAIILWLIKGASHPFRLNSMDRWGALFLFYIWLSLPRTDSFKIGVKEALSLTALFLTYFSVRFLIQNKKEITRLSKWLAAVAGVAGGQAIIQFYLMKKGVLPLYEDRFYRVYTSFGDPTQLANFLIITIPLVGGIYLSEKKIRWAILLPVMVAALFFTFSRSAWVSLFLTFIIFSFFNLKGFKKLICIPLLIMMCAGFIIMSLDRYIVSDDLGGAARVRSLYARKDILFFAISKVWQFPFRGIGPGNFLYRNMEYDERDMVNASVPNTYLHTLVISGIIGFCIMSLFLLLVLRTGSLYINRGGYTFMGLYAGIVSNLIHGCFENLFYNVISNWVFGLILGLMITWQSDESR